jgi:hypothetical protein
MLKCLETWFINCYRTDLLVTALNEIIADVVAGNFRDRTFEDVHSKVNIY